MMPWRPMTPQDLHRVRDAADLIHVDHPEDMAVFAERQRLYPEGCHVLVEEGRVAGYVLSHPWRLAEPPPLNSALGRIPPDATTYYVHDVALLPEARGRGYAAQAVRLVADHARTVGFDNLSLVAVNGSQAFWEGLGFRTRTIPGLEAKLISYGSDAVWMLRNLTTTGSRC